MSGVRLSEVIAPAFFPVHEDLRRAGHAEYWLSGGRGSGKSSFVSLEILLGLMRDSRAGAIIYRKLADTPLPHGAGPPGNRSAHPLPRR